MEEYQKMQKRKQRIFVFLSLCMATVIIISTIVWRRSEYIDSGQQHTIDAVRGLNGEGAVCEGDEKSLTEREKLYLKLCEMYEDVAAWLVIPNTLIDYPLMYTQNATYYQDHSFDRQKDIYGTPYLNAGNAKDFSDPYTIVYGHAMNNSTMFGSLADAKTEDGFDQLSDGVLMLPNGYQCLEVVAVFTADAEISGMSKTLAETKSYDNAGVEALLEKALYRRDDTEIGSGDRLVALTTLAETEGCGAIILLLKIAPWEGF